MFSFRPHVEHMAYLAGLLTGAGHEVHGFTCDAALEHCYSRDLRERSRLLHCAGCVLGGIRSYSIPRLWSIKSNIRASVDPLRLERLTLSSVATRFRTESVPELAAEQMRAAQEQLYPSMEIVYGNAKRWIAESGLDAVLLFNGRMDMVAALAAACEDCGISYVSVERSWFGHGLMLNPNQSCLGLREIKRLSREFCDVPLLTEQACYAGKIASDRFRQQNSLEWRVYNPGAQHVPWPGHDTSSRVLILPSSRNEFEGQADYQTDWGDYRQATERILERLHLDPAGCVLRCHPNWSERIGRRTGWLSERSYTQWAQGLGMTVIPSGSKASTYGLIEQADLVIVNAGSTGVEAGLRGKRVVGIGHAAYEEAGFSVHVPDQGSLSQLDKLDRHDPELTARRALRYVYTYGRRFTQFEQFVRARTTLKYEYLDGADASRIVRMCRDQRLEPDDSNGATDPQLETQVVRQVQTGDWQALAQWQEPAQRSRPIRVRRRLSLRWVDAVRNAQPRGDL
jgi:hypothetical protein